MAQLKEEIKVETGQQRLGHTPQTLVFKPRGSRKPEEEVSPKQVPSNLHFPELQPEGAELRRKKERLRWLALSYTV